MVMPQGILFLKTLLNPDHIAAFCVSVFLFIRKKRLLFFRIKRFSRAAAWLHALHTNRLSSLPQSRLPWQCDGGTVCVLTSVCNILKTGTRESNEKSHKLQQTGFPHQTPPSASFSSSSASSSPSTDNFITSLVSVFVLFLFCFFPLNFDISSGFCITLSGQIRPSGNIVQPQ